MYIWKSCSVAQEKKGGVRGLKREETERKITLTWLEPELLASIWSVLQIVPMKTYLFNPSYTFSARIKFIIVVQC